MGVLAVGALLVGCGGNQPCPVPEDMVDTARGAATDAQRTADEALSRKQNLESQINTKQARIRELEERKKQLEAELAEYTG
jgi:phage shock protein A